MDLGGGGGKGKKPLDTAINLVPFIDLMAVTIVFLIMSAVWTQVGRLQVSQSGQNTEESAPPDTHLQPITVLITEHELKISVGGSQIDPIPMTRNEKQQLDTMKLIDQLKKMKLDQPEQNAITLSTEDAVKYEDLVRVIDACIGNQFPSVSVSPASQT